MSPDRFDLSIFERFEQEAKQARKYHPVMMLAGRKGRAFLVQCSTDAEPPRWNIVGYGFDATFLSLKDLDKFIEGHELHEWTVEDDQKYKRKLSNFCQNRCRINF